MADPSVPVPVPSPAALGRRNKNVLIPFGGKSQLAANRQLFEWSALHLFEPGDNVFVFHYLRKSAFATVSGVVSAASPGGGASSSAAVAAIAAAHPQRPGFTVVNIDAPLPPPAPATAAADTKKEEKKECGDYMTTSIADEEAAVVAAGINDPAEAEWLPRAVSDALRAHRAACPSSFVVVFQIDSAAGPGSAEEAIVEMCKGTFEAPAAPSHLAVPRPDLVCVGSRGQKFLKRLVLGSVSSAVLSTAAAPTCIYRSNLPPPTAAELATRKKLGPAAGGQRAICISLSGSDASHSVAEWACQSLLRPTDKVILLHCANAKKAARRGLSEEHVSANLKACEQTVQSFMTAHATPEPGGLEPGGGVVMPMMLGETPTTAADVRDRLIDFLDKTDVNLLVLGRSNRPGGFKTWALGTVPMYAVQHGNCPVLVVNPPGGPQTEYRAAGDDAEGVATQATGEASGAAEAAEAAAGAAIDAAAEAGRTEGAAVTGTTAPGITA